MKRRFKANLKRRAHNGVRWRPQAKTNVMALLYFIVLDWPANRIEDHCVTLNLEPLVKQFHDQLSRP